MAGFYHDFTTANRPNLPTLLTNLRALDPSAGVWAEGSIFHVKKNSDWAPGDITAAQNVIDTSPASTPALLVQQTVDAMPILERAIILTLLDQINVLRAALPVPLPAVTPAQAVTAVRAKAGTLL